MVDRKMVESIIANSADSYKVTGESVLDDGSTLVEYSIFVGGDITRFNITYKPDGTASMQIDYIGSDVGEGILSTLHSILKIYGG